MIDLNNLNPEDVQDIVPCYRKVSIYTDLNDETTSSATDEEVSTQISLFLEKIKKDNPNIVNLSVINCDTVYVAGFKAFGLEYFPRILTVVHVAYSLIIFKNVKKSQKNPNVN